MRGALLAMAMVAPAAIASMQPADPPRYTSTITIYDVAARSSTVVYRGDGIWEAPNWSRDGKFLLVNSDGKLYRLAVDGGSPPEPLALDPSLRANNDHDFSPDGKRLAISASSPSSRQSQVYVANADGTGHRLTVDAAPSYFHGWSPDGKFLSFIANRDGKQYDVYRVASEGGREERLTVDPGNDDGSDYSPDGRWIYFNSNRGGGLSRTEAGGWNIWRMPAAGAGANDAKAERITNDALEDWFPHPSPDGKSLVFLSFPAGTEGHNDRTLQVQLRMLPMPGARIGNATPQTLATFSGGQGTINVNSWAPDSRRFAYVSYATSASGATGRTHRLEATPSTVAYGYYWSEAKPVLRIASGDVIDVDTLITNSPAGLQKAGVPDEKIQSSLKSIVAEVTGDRRGPGGHILTGPVYIEGAEPGDTLAVKVLSIDLPIDYGYNGCSGFLPENCDKTVPMKIVALDRAAMSAEFFPGIVIPLRPFFGSMGVAPAPDAGRVSSNPPGRHAGNLDNRELVAGSTLYIPVFVPGALFEIGDGHAAQGDGEVDQTAIETSLRGRVQLTVIKGEKLAWPRAETAGDFISMASDPDLTTATRLAVQEMIDFLVAKKGLTRHQAYQLVSVAGHVAVTQLVDKPVMGVHVKIAKSIFKR